MRWFWTMAGAVSAAIAMRAVRRHWLVITVYGVSMSTSYPAGSRVLVRRRRSAPNRGDVVLVPHPDVDAGWQLTASPPADGSPSWFLKRVTAIAGDPLPDQPGGLLPLGTVYLLGENDQSWDSRRLGPCPVAAVSGVVVATLSSPSNR